MDPCRRTTMVQVLVVFAALAVSGCARKPPPRFYLLDPGIQPERLASVTGEQRGVAVGVSPVQLSAHLNRLQIVTRESRSQVALSDANQWAEPLREGVQDMIVSTLATELASNRIHQLPLVRPRALEYRVAVEIMRLDGRLEGDVHLVARWVLSSGDGSRDLFGKLSRISEPTGGEDYASLVEAEARAVSALAREIAEVIREDRGGGHEDETRRGKP